VALAGSRRGRFCFESVRAASDANRRDVAGRRGTSQPSRGRG
jgi:hypothetical protein